jgi:hypothetical protein
MSAAAGCAWTSRDPGQKPRMPQNLRRPKGTAMPHMEAPDASLHEAFEFAGNRLRVIFERRPDGMAFERDALTVVTG